MPEQDKQLVDEQEMQTMSVAPPDPDAEKPQTSGGESLMQQLQDSPGEHRLDQDTALDSPGVADEDPLSAHPS